MAGKANMADADTEQAQEFPSERSRALGAALQIIRGMETHTYSPSFIDKTCGPYARYYLRMCMKKIEEFERTGSTAGITVAKFDGRE